MRHPPGSVGGQIAAQALDQINQQRVQQFAERIVPDVEILSNALSALKAQEQCYRHEAQVSPTEKVQDLLPAAHIVISNLKRYLLGACHEVSRTGLREYIDEFEFRFNRRSWESQLPRRLIQAAVDHVPIRLTHVLKHVDSLSSK